MVKVVEKNVEQVRGIDYPKLMIGSSNAIVLFVDDNKGTVVKSGGGFSVGRYSETWNMNAFKDYTGTLELSNE